MLINIDLTKISAKNTIVLANNRQVLAFKKTWQQQKGVSKLPKILAWKQYLCAAWTQNNPHTKTRFIADIEARMLIAKSMSDLGVAADNQLIDEVVKNYQYCRAHLIEIAKLRLMRSEIYAAFGSWIEKYQQYKTKLNLVDIFDLSAIILNHKKQLPPPYIYGFKALTPEQSHLLTALKYKTFPPQNQTHKNSINQVFATTYDEILSAAIWAKKLNQANPKTQIAIVSPKLNELRHLFQSIFDEVFADVLSATGQKSYNISLGLPLTQYPLIEDLLLLLKLSHQISQNRIQTTIFNMVIISPYIYGAENEKSSRALLVNQVLRLSKKHFSLDKIDKYLPNCPTLKHIIDNLNKRKNPKQQRGDEWLEDFNHLLKIWGFSSDRTLSSVEHQLFKKYQQCSLSLNKLSQYYKKMNGANAVLNLQSWLSQVIFQAQSEQKVCIHILGALEAEGLYFDHAWVLNMTHNFLPAAINSPHFIPFDICLKHQIMRSDYALIAEDATATLTQLYALCDEVIFSYGKIHDEQQQQASTLIEFKHKTQKIQHQYSAVAYDFLDDANASAINTKQVQNGVGILKNQMACAFKGFAQRLNIPQYDPPHIGFNRKQQGIILHQVLQSIYQQIPNQSSLMAYKNADLIHLIEAKIEKTLRPYRSYGFASVEKQRLLDLLLKFIDAEKQRDAFSVIATEQKLDADINGLKFTTRLDRIDELANSERVIFDYKIGKTSLNSWCGETITEPQLVIYALCTITHNISFIQLDKGQINYKYWGGNANLGTQSKRHNCIKWDAQMLIWKEKLNQASADFQQGKASVLPTKKACEYCQYDSLCRIEK